MSTTERVVWFVVALISFGVAAVIICWFRNIRRSESAGITGLADRRGEAPLGPVSDRPFDFDHQGWSHVDLRNPNAVLYEIEKIVTGERTAWLDRIEMIKDLLQTYRAYNKPAGVPRYRPDGAYGW